SRTRSTARPGPRGSPPRSRCRVAAPCCRCAPRRIPDHVAAAPPPRRRLAPCPAGTACRSRRSRTRPGRAAPGRSRPSAGSLRVRRDKFTALTVGVHHVLPHVRVDRIVRAAVDVALVELLQDHGEPEDPVHPVEGPVLGDLLLTAGAL